MSKTSLPPIVCDATVVLNLGHRGNLLELTRRLRAERELYVTPEVQLEVIRNDPQYYSFFLEEHFSTIEEFVYDPAQFAALPVGLLDEGELSVLAVCLKKGWLAGIDELGGRKAAKALAIPLIGTLGIIERAVKMNWMEDEEALESLRLLRSSGFHCPKVLANDSFYEYISRLK